MLLKISSIDRLLKNALHLHQTREKIQTTETQLEASQEYNRSLEKKIDKLLKVLDKKDIVQSFN